MPDRLFGFLKDLRDGDNDHDWDEPGLRILQIPEDPADPNTRYDETTRTDSNRDDTCQP
jgi:hypothetical protein